jgi:hypothetical protein
VNWNLDILGSSTDKERLDLTKRLILENISVAREFAGKMGRSAVSKEVAVYPSMTTDVV